MLGNSLGPSFISKQQTLHQQTLRQEMNLDTFRTFFVYDSEIMLEKEPMLKIILESATSYTVWAADLLHSTDIFS